AEREKEARACTHRCAVSHRNGCPTGIRSQQSRESPSKTCPRPKLALAYLSGRNRPLCRRLQPHARTRKPSQTPWRVSPERQVLHRNPRIKMLTIRDLSV